MSRILILFFLFCGTLSAQHRFSLKQAQTHAMQHNKEMKNARLDVSYAKKQVLETTAIGLPHVSAEAQWQQFLEIPTTLVPAQMFDPNADSDDFSELQFGTEHNASATLNASQLLFDGSYIVGLKAASTFKKMAQQSLQLTEQQVKDNIALAYWGVLLAEEKKLFLKEVVLIHKDILEETAARYEMGFVEDLEVDRMTLVLSNMQTQSDNANRMTEVSLLNLKMMLGLSLDESLELTDSLEQLSAQSKAFEFEESQWQSRIEYQLANTQTAINKLDLRRYQSQYLPSIAAFGSYSENAMRNEFNFDDSDRSWYPTKVFGVKATLNLFDGLNRMAKVQKAKIKLQQARNDQQNIAQALQLEYQQALSAYLTAISNIEHKDKSLSLSKKIYQKTLVKYQEGLVSSVELSQSGADYLESHSNYSQAMYDLLSTEMNYQRTLGK